MVIGESIGSTDVAILGAGPGGYTAAIKLAQLGKKVTLIDRESVGGVCLHHGCIPTKAMIHAAGKFQELQHLGTMGITCDNPKIDFAKMIAWRNESVKKLDNGIRGLLKHYHIQLLKANAFFEESNKLKLEKIDQDIDINALEFKKIIIATGSKERLIPGIEIDGKTVLTSFHALQMESLPSSVLVIGGGYIGIELSQMLAKFGVKITIVEALPHILELLDDDISSIIAKSLKELNVDVFTKVKVQKVEVRDGKAVTTFIDGSGASHEVISDKAVVAIGRVPDTAALQLANTKVKVDAHGFIEVDTSMQTADPRISAIGDVVGGIMLAHKAAFEGKIAAEVIAGQKSVFDNVVPFAIFSDPEVAGVGLTEKEAIAKKISYTAKKFSYDGLGKAKILNSPGFFKVLFDEQKNILGVHIVGARASDMIGEGVLAMEMGATLEDLSLIIHPHPTLVEGYGELADLALGFPINGL